MPPARAWRPKNGGPRARGVRQRKPRALQEALKRLFSQREDVTLNNPLSPPARGWDEVAAIAPSASFHEPSGTSPPSWLSSCVAPSPFLLTRTNRRPAASRGSGTQDESRHYPVHEHKRLGRLNSLALISPSFGEGVFLELRVDGVLRSSPKKVGPNHRRALE